MQWKLALAFAAILFVLVNLYLFQVFDEGLQEKAGPNFGFHRSDWRSLSPVVDQGHCVDDLQHCTANLCVANASTALRTCRATCGLCRPARFFDVKDRTLLSNLRLMPQVGFGTAGLGDGTRAAVLSALRVGYRLLDSAQAREWYREDLVGEAITDSGVPRKDLFLTSKLHPRDLHDPLGRLQQSLTDLNTTYLDLFLLHYPRCFGELCPPSPAGAWQHAWQQLETVVPARVRALGVSNFGLEELSELVELAHIRPAVVQANSDIFDANALIQAFCQLAGIKFQGYSSLGTQWLMRGRSPNPVLQNKVVHAIATAHGKDPAQVALRHALQRGQGVIPRSSNKSRMTANLDVLRFRLSRLEMDALDSLDGSLA